MIELYILIGLLLFFVRALLQVQFLQNTNVRVTPLKTFIYSGWVVLWPVYLL